MELKTGGRQRSKRQNANADFGLQSVYLKNVIMKLYIGEFEELVLLTIASLGEEAYGVIKKTKTIFDPYGTLNAGVKIDVEIEDIKPLLRQDFSLQHLYSHMPRT